MRRILRVESEKGLSVSLLSYVLTFFALTPQYITDEIEYYNKITFFTGVYSGRLSTEIFEKRLSTTNVLLGM